MQEIIEIDNLSSTKVTTLGCQVHRRSTQLFFRLEPFSRDRNPSQLNQYTKNKIKFEWLLMQSVWYMYEISVLPTRFMNNVRCTGSLLGSYVAWVFG